MRTNDVVEELSRLITYTDIYRSGNLTVDKLWTIMSAKLFEGQEIGDVQRIEMKRAFFIGFGECFKMTMDLSSDLPEEEAMKVFTTIGTEIREFQDKTLEELFPS